VVKAKDLSKAGRAYVGAVGFFGVLLLAHCANVLLHRGVPYQWGVFAALALISGRLTVKVPGVKAFFAVSEIFTFSCMLLFGPEAGAVTLALDALVLGWHQRMGLLKTAFNLGTLALTSWVAGTAFFTLSGVEPLFGQAAPTLPLIGPLALLAASFYIINTGLIAGAIAFETRGHAFHIWRTHFVWLAPGFAASASVALLLVSALQQMKFTTELMPVLLLVPPLFVVFYFTLRTSFGRLEDAKGHVATLNRLYLSTVETLATAIDAKDEVTHGHIRRVQVGTVALARALGVNDDLTVQALEAAALLHDTGKIAVPEHILNKPGKLTPAEFEKMKLHAPIGAEILSSIDFPYPVVPIVRHHHENWDGTGYPDGLRETQIPLGARILSVVDCFDALTSDRPYRRRMSDEEALRIVLDRRGSMYDPVIVDTFVASYKQIMPPSEENAHPVARALGGAREAVRQPTPPPEPAIVDAPVSDEVLAVSSLARAVAGEATLTDVGALAWMMIRNLVPCASMALFVNDEGQDLVVVRFAAGAHVATLRRVRKPRGTGIAGWVSATRRGALNADPALDLGPDAGTMTPPLRAALAVPLIHDGGCGGVLAVYQSTSNAFSEDQLRLLELLAPSFAAAVASVNAAEQPVAAMAGTRRQRTGDLRLLRRAERKM
jgi:putative nucleotidyltransferase with HDIG domain